MYELFFVQDESATVYTSESANRFSNCLICIPPFCKHRTTRTAGLRILFSYDKAFSGNTEFSQFMNSFFSATEPFDIPCDSKLAFLFEELDNSFDVNNRLSDEVSISVITLIFCHIFKNHGTSSAPDFTSRNENYLVKIDDIINAFQSDITLSTLADALHLSTKQTTRILQKNYKKKLSEIMIEKRLSVAAELLLRTNKTVSEIVEYVNFPSERYFYSQFKKVYGCTPLKYKKQNIEKSL